jgi:hypothetical protein
MKFPSSSLLFAHVLLEVAKVMEPEQHREAAERLRAVAATADELDREALETTAGTLERYADDRDRHPSTVTVQPSSVAPEAEQQRWEIPLQLKATSKPSLS